MNKHEEVGVSSAPVRKHHILLRQEVANIIIGAKIRLSYTKT